MNTNNWFRSNFSYYFLAGLLSLFLASCKDGDPIPPPVDLSGTWAGTWSGTDAEYGQVSGNWEAELDQLGFKVRGTMRLSGDIDCPDGAVAGTIGANGVVAGTVTREPCPYNEWALTAISLVERSATGAWTKPASGGRGTLTGSQIATPDGPRISFVNPPGGLPGTIVTVVGSRFSATAAENQLDFNAILASGFIESSTTKIVVDVPDGVSGGPLYLTTAKGTAISPQPFFTNVTFPRAVQSASIPMSSGYSYYNYNPEGVAFNPDGRRAYVTTKGDGRISMINTATNQIVFSAPADDEATVPVQGIVVSPDGRKLYAAGSYRGVKVLDSVTLKVLDTLPANAGGAARPNPQGLAISPDGRLLFVSNNQDGGGVSVLDIATKTQVAFVTEGAGAVPLGIAVNPDGREAYMAFNGPNLIKVFNIAQTAVTDMISAGSGPIGVAVSPDGKTAYVTNESDNSISIIDLVTRMTISSIPVGSLPAGIAISPDGMRAYVANRQSNSVSVIDLVTNQTFTSAIVGTNPTGIAMSPDGMRAYVTNSAENSVSELGGPITLTITKEGSGTGTVTSSPAGIDCGTNCQARYDLWTVVTLSATSASGSYFSGWSSDCYGGTVTMNTSKTCTAAFYVSSSGGGGGGGGCIIATAAFGGPDDPRVKVLNDFHEKYVNATRVGRAITKFYHAYAPPVADFVSRYEAARFAVRMILMPVVYALRYPAWALFVMMALIGGLGLVRNRWIGRQQ